MKIKVTEYEVEVEDSSPERTTDRQAVLYLHSDPDTEVFESDDEKPAQFQALIYRTKVSLQTTGTRAVIYADRSVKCYANNGIIFIDSSQH